MPPSREVFDRQRRPRFGSANPERMPMEFWEWMIRGEGNLQGDEGSVFRELGLIMRDGKLKGTSGPWRARDLFGLKTVREDGPIWTFDRYGATQTDLPDGRILCVGGEHEDWYDPDFCIYNDVVVFGPDGSLEIYGYPKAVFPPTDFHTANLIDGQIILIGGLGYPDDRRPGFTPVYRLDPTTYQMTAIETTGDAPGWISKHEAEVGADGSIRVRGGKIFDVSPEGRHSLRPNTEEYTLCLETRAWRVTTHAEVTRYAIVRADRFALLPLADCSNFVDADAGDRKPRKPIDDVADLIPGELVAEARLDANSRTIQLIWEGFPVTIEVTPHQVRLAVEGMVPERRANDLAEQVRWQVELTVDVPCVCENLTGGTDHPAA